MKTLLMRKWRFLAVMSATLAVLLILSLFWGFSQRDAAKAAMRAEQSLNQRSYEGLLSDLSALSDQFGKLQIASTPEQCQPLLAEAFRKSGEAALLLEQMPLDSETSAALMQFVNQTGDYAAFLLRKVSRSEMLDAKAVNQLSALENSCKELLEKLRPANDLPNALANLKLDIDAAGIMSSAAIGSYGFPTLLYDGPFSDSTLKSEPRGLQYELSSMSEAADVTQKLTGSDSLFSGELVTNAQIPYYHFSGYRYGAQIDIAITLYGARPLWWTEDTKSDEYAAPTEEQRLIAFKKAGETLLANGFTDMEPTYWQLTGGVGTVGFAATQGGVLLYPDLVKVWVDFERERVVGLDARNYHMSHVKRTVPVSYRSLEQARASISPRIETKPDARLCVIPLPYGDERLCYEFRANNGGDEYLIYIDALTGAERDILRVVKTPYGTLVR